MPLLTPSRSDQLILAELVARHAHSDQRDLSGAPYILHVQRVVARVTSDDARIVAWLHDVLEDSDLTAHDLLDLGIEPSLVQSVLRLTRVEEQSYAEYISTLIAAPDPLAREVKLADLLDHVRPGCPARLRPRYEHALARLTGRAA